jgi:hypothetical protein
MGLKSNDACLAKVYSDEPIFVLRAQDRLAPALVKLWAELASLHGAPFGKTAEAIKLAMRMEGWAATNHTKWPD